MTLLGIDPGVTGAVSCFINGKLVEVLDIPFLNESSKSKKRIDLLGMVGLVEHCIALSGNRMKLIIYLEHAQCMPKQGISSTFNYGRTNGIIEGVLAGLGIDTVKKVVPARWKRMLNLLGNGSPKNADLKKARDLYPNAPLNLQKHHNRADAILIGHYGCLMEKLLK